MLSGAEIGTVFTALSLVYQSYSKIRSNKERCRRVLERCQMIVDRLQETRNNVDDNDRICERIRVLERTFVRAADAIAKVGQQSWLKSLLKSEENTFLIDDTQHELTNLVTVLNLEQTIDFSAWQKEYETARVQDHHTLMSVGRRLEQGNVAILTELTRQGASLTQLSAVMKSLRANTESDIGLPSAIAEDDDFVSDLLDEGVPRPRAMSAPASSSSVHAGGASKPNGLNRSLSPSFSTRRPSWVRKISIPVFASLVPRISPHHSPSFSPSPPGDTETSDINAEDPQTPPPAYYTITESTVHVEDVAAEDDDIRAASVAATVSSETPPRSPLSPFSIADQETVEQEPILLVKKVRFAINDIDLRTSELSTTGPYGYFNRRVLVELWTLPKHLRFDQAVPLSHFVPVQNDNMAVVKQKAGDISKSLRPMIHRRSSKLSLFTYVFLLCPKDEKPFVVQMKKNQPRPQQAVKAYVLNSSLQVTVVSVKHGSERQLFLLPYYPDMSVLHAKACIEDFFDRQLTIKSVRISKSNMNLSDDDTLALSGVKPYANQLRMTVQSI